MDWGQLASVALGGLLAILGGLVATLIAGHQARKLAEDERRQLAARHEAECIAELQLATLRLMRAIVDYRGVCREDLLYGGGEWDFEDEYAKVVPPLIDAMAVVQLVAGRLDNLVSSSALVVHARASNMLMGRRLERPEGVTRMEQLEHQLDEALAHGQQTIEQGNEMLRTLPPPSVYRPITAWEVRSAP